MSERINETMDAVSGGRVINDNTQPVYDTYIVQQGESLDSIANKLMYVGGWLAIFNLNRDKIANANLIHPGQQLRVRHDCIMNPLYQ